MLHLMIHPSVFFHSKAVVCAVLCVLIWYSACHRLAPSWHDIIADMLSGVVSGAAFGFLDHSVKSLDCLSSGGNGCNPEGFLQRPYAGCRLLETPFSETIFHLFDPFLTPQMVLSSYLKCQIDKLSECDGADFSSLTRDFSKMPPLSPVNL